LGFALTKYFALRLKTSYPLRMQNSARIWAAVIGVAIVILIVFALLQKPAAAPATDTTASSTSGTSATGTTTRNGVTGTGDFSVTGDTIDLNIPDFRAPINFSSSIQADVKAALESTATKLEAKLTADSLDLESWVNLGVVRKMGGDYAGAEKAWLFVTQAAPNNPLAYANLGDLYQNFIKNYPKAEKNYLTEIKLSPKDEGAYLNLYTMYANQYKQGTSAAEDILKKGIAALPDSVALHVQLARFYKAKNDTTDARVQYDAAIAAANKAGQGAVALQIQAEENQ
jgi:Tfp pilus assembly protein PilF